LRTVRPAERDGRLSESFRDHERRGHVPAADGRLRGRAIEERFLLPALGDSARDDRQTLLGLERVGEPPGVLAAVFVHDGEEDLPRATPRASEDPGEDREEDDRDHERQHESGAIPAKPRQVRPEDGEDHSRSSLPVRLRNTSSSVALFNVRSRIRTWFSWKTWRSSRTRAAASSTEAWTRVPSTTAPKLRRG